MKQLIFFKISVLSLILILFQQTAHTQCDKTLPAITSQAQLDALNPCDTIDGNVVVSGIDITDLSNLENIVDLGFFGSFTIRGTGVEHINGLNNLVGRAYYLNITDNTRLKTIKGFNKARAGADAGVTISNNPLLETIEGFNSTRLTFSKIENNPQLRRIAAFQRHSGFALDILNNPLLTDCCQIPNNSIYLSGNGYPCNTSENDDRIFMCQNNFFVLKPFMDDNLNGHRDAGETSISLLSSQFDCLPDPLYSEVVDDSLLIYWTNFYDGYDVIDNSTIYDITTDPSYLFVLSSDTLEIGLTQVADTTILNTKTVSENMICNAEGVLEIISENLGSRDFSGSMEIEFPSELQLVSASEAYTLSGNIARLDIADLEKQTSENLTLSFDMPSEQSLGDYFKIDIRYLRPSGAVVHESYHHFVLLCAFDPNDKQVHPQRDTLLNPTLFGEKLNYKIRFENLGNLAATNVFIIDYLDPNLDHSTFKLISSSHKVTDIFLDSTGYLKINFDSILLAGADMPELNKGYVQYEIEPKTGLPENTAIYNQAEIYFDLNAPIFTNSTINTLVNNFVGIDELQRPQNSSQIVVHPNPSRAHLFLNLEKGKLKITAPNGQSVMTRSLEKNEPLDVSALHPGLYYLTHYDNLNGKQKVGKFVKI